MSRVLKTPLAKDDLKAIGRYIRLATKSRDRALSVLSSIASRAKIYAAAPEMGEQRSDLGMNVRMFLAANYVCLYQPVEGGIELLRIVHSTRDLPEIRRKQIPNDPQP